MNRYRTPTPVLWVGQNTWNRTKVYLKPDYDETLTMCETLAMSERDTHNREKTERECERGKA
jgi:hypothetical protein